MIKEHGQPQAEGLSDGCPDVRLGEERGHEQGNRSEEKQAGLEACAHAVELLLVMPEAANQERAAEHEQGIGDDGPGY